MRGIPWKEGEGGVAGGKGAACSKEGEMGTLSSVQGPVDPGTGACTRHANYVK